MNHHYAFGILPTIMRHDGRVSDFACRLYSEVDSLSNKFGYCFATNAALAKTLHKSESQISRTLSELEVLGYVLMILENGHKRKIYPKRDFRDMEGVVEIAEGGTQNCVGGSAFLQRGVRKNSMTVNKIINQEEQNKNNIVPSIEIEVHEQVDDVSTTIYDMIPFAQQPEEKPNKQMQFVAEVINYLNEKTNQQFKPTTKETIQFINSRVKLDKWELEDFKAVIDSKVREWMKDDKMRHYLCPSTLFRASNAEKYLLAAKASKPKPVAPKIQPTKVHIEEKSVLTQQDIEATAQNVAAVSELFKNMGVRV